MVEPPLYKVPFFKHTIIRHISSSFLRLISDEGNYQKWFLSVATQLVHRPIICSFQIWSFSFPLSHLSLSRVFKATSEHHLRSTIPFQHSLACLLLVVSEKEPCEHIFRSLLPTIMHLFVVVGIDQKEVQIHQTLTILMWSAITPGWTTANSLEESNSKICLCL